MKQDMEKFKIGDTVSVAKNVTLSNIDGSRMYEVKADKNYKVAWVFKDFDGRVGCVLEIDDFSVPFPEDDLILQERAPQKPDNEPALEPNEVKKIMENIAAKIPRHSAGFVWSINKTLVAAHSLEDAICIFREQAENEVIDEIKLLSHDSAYIQNEIPII